VFGHLRSAISSRRFFEILDALIVGGVEAAVSAARASLPTQWSRPGETKVCLQLLKHRLMRERSDPSIKAA